MRYVLDARRAFLADEQGLGKTVEALAALEADGAYPAVVVCPASLKLNWEREAARWLPHREVAVVEGRVAVPPRGEITILNYEIVAAHREALARRGPRALVVDESHYVKNPQAKRTQAVRRLAGAVADDGLRLALTGTPVLNHAEELDRAAARHRPARGLRLAARASPRQFHGEPLRGAPALAPAPALLRAPPEGRRAAPAAGQAPGRRARSRSTTSASTGSPRRT